MRVRFQRANHRTGNESIVLKFDGVVQGQTACILVDAGGDVDVQSLLGPDEYLAANLVTHAHVDHIRSLGSNVVDGAPVLACEPTASLLDAALSEGKRQERVHGDVDTVVDSLEALSGWRSIAGGGDLRVAPIPAGHAPGASGFVVQFRDDDVARNLLISGDFTTTEAGGYPAFTRELPLDVEAMVVNVSTTADFEAALTDAVETTLARATEGFTTVATCGALIGVHLARVLQKAISRWNLDVTVHLVGQTAKLYANLDVSTDGLALHPEFADPEAVLAAGDVTIAGPAVPIDGSALRLFETIENDPNAALVQVTSGALDAVSSAGCTTYSFEVSAHPTADTVDAVVEAYDPLHVVVGHATGSDLDAYKDKYAAFVWANQDALEQTLYEDGEWQAPPWVSERAERYVYGNTTEFGGNVIPDGEDVLDVSLPDVTPGEVTLHAEGVDVPRLHDRFATVGEESSSTDQASDGDPTLDDVIDRLDRIEATLDASGEFAGDSTVRARFSADVVDLDGQTHVRVPDDVVVTDGDRVSVLTEQRLREEAGSDHSTLDATAASANVDADDESTPGRGTDDGEHSGSGGRMGDGEHSEDGGSEGDERDEPLTDCN